MFVYRLLEQVLHDARDVHPVEVVFPVNGLGIKVEDASIIVNHGESELIEVEVMEASLEQRKGSIYVHELYEDPARMLLVFLDRGCVLHHQDDTTTEPSKRLSLILTCTSPPGHGIVDLAQIGRNRG